MSLFVGLTWRWGRPCKHVLSPLGTCRFRVINYRADMRFALIRNGLQYPKVVAWSHVIRFTNPNAPHHGHLALTANPRYHMSSLL